MMRLRAQWAYPVSGPPIQDAELVIDGGRLVEVRQRPCDGQPVTDARDLGQAILMPGLVNAHTHIEYTLLRGAAEDLPMFPWLDRLIRLKMLLEHEEWHASALQGAMELARGGVTTVADCTDSGVAAAALTVVGLRGIVYQEVFGIDPREPVSDGLDALDRKVAALRRDAEGGGLRVGISPHSVYTVRPELLQALGKYAKRNGLPICVHAAESDAEVELLLRGTGPRAARLRQRGVEWRTPGHGVLAHLNAAGVLGPSTLLAHCVKVSRTEARLLADTGTSVVVCPRSNALLGNQTPPLNLLLRWCADEDPSKPPRVGLGTDSAVSCHNLDMLEEMRVGLLLQRAARATAEKPTAADMLRLATLGGAYALGLGEEIGSLEVGKAADIIAVRYPSGFRRSGADLATVLVHGCSSRDVMMTMVGGRIVSGHGAPRTYLAARQRNTLRRALARLRASAGTVA